ncbi:hypothetical protein C8Q74DRAFT_1305325, partial [Fomes fomentarius]
HFKENPYFSNTVLKKEYKYVPPPVDTEDKPDADGITDTMLEFSWERDVEPQVRRGGSRVASTLIRDRFVHKVSIARLDFNLQIEYVSVPRKSAGVFVQEEHERVRVAGWSGDRLHG